MKPLILFLALLLSPLAVAAQTLYVQQTEDGYLNIRSGPSTQFDILGRLSPGDRVEVRETMGKWARVRLPSGKIGWVSLTYLERGPAPGGDVLFVNQTNDGFLNLRSGPGTRYEILRRMYPGDRLVPLERDGAWVRVRHVSGAIGWAHSGYMSP